MSEYTAEVFWERHDQPFLDNRYSRRHIVSFDGGVEFDGSSSVHSVPLPMSDPGAVDPEELFVASLATCHMLWFLSVAAKHKFIVDRYCDNALGLMQKNAEGRVAVTHVTLRPEVWFAEGHSPSREQLDALHHEAHEECYIANSVRTEVRCEPV